MVWCIRYKTSFFLTTRRYRPCDYSHEWEKKKTGKYNQRLEEIRGSSLWGVENWLNFLSLPNLLHYCDKAQSTYTYQCDPQAPDIRADIISLSWCTWVYSFRLEHKEKSWLLIIQTTREENGSNSWVVAKTPACSLGESMSGVRSAVRKANITNNQQGKKSINGFLHKGNTK